MTSDTDRLAEGRDRVETAIVGFVRALRRRGVDVTADGSLEAARTLAVVDIDDRERVASALRSTLVSRPADLSTFDDLFPVFWANLHSDSTGSPSESSPTDPFAEVAPHRSDPQTSATGSGFGSPSGDGEGAIEGRIRNVERRTAPGTERGASDGEGDDAGIAASVYSRSGRPERVAGASVGRASDLERAVDDLVDILARAPGRRWERGDVAIDAHRLLRESVSTGGAVLSIPERRHSTTALDAAVLVDVSRSVLEAVDRPFLLAVLDALERACRSLRVFFFDTDVREVTDAVAAPAGIGRALEDAETEWGGGTRIGHCLGTIRHGYPDAVDRSTRTLVVSDGLEVGDIDELEREMAHLARRASSVLWLNPLAASVEYEPTCRGMAGALPYVDGLFAFADVTDVRDIARQVRQRGLGGSIGYRHDHRRGPGARK